MDVVAAWFAMAFIVEEAVEIIKRLFPILGEIKIQEVNLSLLLALAISLVITFGGGMDFFVMFNIEFGWPYVGPILSALLMTGGSEFVHKVKDRIAA